MNDQLSLKSRREFIRTSAIGAAFTWTVPAFLAQTFSSLGAQSAKDDTILVVLQMAGGNDGLNTVVPFTNDHYHKARPRIGLKGDAVLKIDDALGFSDPERLARMGAVFDQVGADGQVIILTCSPERYAAVANARRVQLTA